MSANNIIADAAALRGLLERTATPQVPRKSRMSWDCKTRLLTHDPETDFAIITPQVPRK